MFSIITGVTGRAVRRTALRVAGSVTVCKHCSCIAYGVTVCVLRVYR